jgi:hypothetical protein
MRASLQSLSGATIFLRLVCFKYAYRFLLGDMPANPPRNDLAAAHREAGK